MHAPPTHFGATFENIFYNNLKSSNFLAKLLTPNVEVLIAHIYTTINSTELEKCEKDTKNQESPKNIPTPSIEKNQFRSISTIKMRKV